MMNGSDLIHEVARHLVRYSRIILVGYSTFSQCISDSIFSGQCCFAVDRNPVAGEVFLFGKQRKIGTQTKK